MDRRTPLAFAAAALAAGPAGAQLLIAPTTVEIVGQRHSAAIEITNQADTPADLQFRAFAWSQANGRDWLYATEDLAISPPIATLPPHGRQVFRILNLRQAADTATSPAERDYRLLLNQLPDRTATAVRINIEFSLPVFVTPKDAVAAPVWRPSVDGISLLNTGTRRMRLHDLAIRSPDGLRIELPAAASAYLLAGASRSFRLPPGTRVEAGSRLVGTSDAGRIDEPLLALAAR